MTRQLYFFNVVLFAVVSVTQSAAQPSQECSMQMGKVGLSAENFAFSVAHGVHSLTIEDLKKFNPLVNETNRVPTVNMDLLSNQPLLSSAPHAEPLTGGTFKTQGMQRVDRQLSNMDRKHYGASGYTTLEKVVHALHMADCWQMALVEYQQMVANKASKEVCPCLLDVDSIGLTTQLRDFALKLREPELLYKDHLEDYEDGNWIYYLWAKATKGRVLRTKKDGLPKLTSSKTWALWKKQFQSMDAKDDYALAYFLYCSLN